MTALGDWDEETFRGEWEDLSWLEGKKSLKGMDENGEPKLDEKNKRRNKTNSFGDSDGVGGDGGAGANGNGGISTSKNPFALLDQQRFIEAMAEGAEEEEVEPE